jgi:hypothetical protein
MRRLIAIFLLVLLPLQAVLAAVEPYCLHESDQRQSNASSHLGHHEHERHADASGVQVDADLTGDGKSSATLDHDHHCCCACASMLPALVQLPGPLPQVDGVASPLASYASFDATRIERPNWAVSH